MMQDRSSKAKRVKIHLPPMEVTAGAGNGELLAARWSWQQLDEVADGWWLAEEAGSSPFSWKLSQKWRRRGREEVVAAGRTDDDEKLLRWWWSEGNDRRRQVAVEVGDDGRKWKRKGKRKEERRIKRNGYLFVNKIKTIHIYIYIY